MNLRVELKLVDRRSAKYVHVLIPKSYEFVRRNGKGQFRLHMKLGNQVSYNRGPQTPHPYPRPHSRRWAVGKWAKLHGPLPLAHITAWNISPHPWKNCLPRLAQALVPKRLGTAVIRTRNKLQCFQPLKFWGLWEHLASP